MSMFVLMFDSRAGTLVGPSRQRLSEMRGENGMRNFVRQNGVEDPLTRPLNLHFPTEWLTAAEHEAGSSTRTKVRLHIDAHEH